MPGRKKLINRPQNNIITLKSWIINYQNVYENFYLYGENSYFVFSTLGQVGLWWILRGFLCSLGTMRQSTKWPCTYPYIRDKRNYSELLAVNIKKRHQTLNCSNSDLFQNNEHKKKVFQVAKLLYIKLGLTVRLSFHNDLV